MEFKDLQKEILYTAKRYEKKYKVKIDENTAIIKLFEEAGEFAEAVLTRRKKSRPEKHLPPKKAKEKVSQELADVFGMSIVTADRLGVDLEKAIKIKWIYKKKK